MILTTRGFAVKRVKNIPDGDATRVLDDDSEVEHRMRDDKTRERHSGSKHVQLWIALRVW